MTVRTVPKHKTPPELGGLQRAILRMALVAHYRKPLGVACGSQHPGSFGLKTEMRRFGDRRVRNARRAASGAAIARLIKRGLVEPCGRGAWRLTRTGLIAARTLYPEIKPLTKSELIAAIDWLGQHRGKSVRRRRARDTTKETSTGVDWRGRALRTPRGAAKPLNTPTIDPRIAPVSDGIEIPWDG